MTPVDRTQTCRASQPRVAATERAIAWQSAAPCWLVQALAFPELMTTAHGFGRGDLAIPINTRGPDKVLCIDAGRNARCVGRYEAKVEACGFDSAMHSSELKSFGNFHIVPSLNETRRFVEIVHQIKILNCGARRPFDKIVQYRDENYGLVALTNGNIAKIRMAHIFG